MRKIGLVLIACFSLLFLLTHPSWSQEKLTNYQELLDWIKSPQPDPPPFKPGDVLTYKDVEKLKPFVSPDFWPHVFFEGMKIRIRKTETPDVTPHQGYIEATKKYSGQVKLGPQGELLNYVSGYPFPPEEIKLEDPQAGIKVGWNYDKRWQAEGLGAGLWNILLVSKGGGVDRSYLGGPYKRYYYTNRADLKDSNYTIPIKGAEKYHFKDWIQMSAPFDVKDTTFVLIRHQDPFKEDNAWAYLPSMRRVRRMSMAARHDAFMGSEWTFDDFNNFTGRVADWDWKYLAKKKILTPLSSWLFAASPGQPQGKLGGTFKNVQVGDTWAIMEHFIVESTPKWKGHPYGRKTFYTEAKAFQSFFTSTWDKKGDLWKTFMVAWRWGEETPEDCSDCLTYNPGWKVLSCNLLSAVDWQAMKATIFIIDPKIGRE